jgi:hypothetical protein
MSGRRSSTRARVVLGLIVAFGVLLLYSANVALRTGLADVYAAPAMRYLQAKDDAGMPLTEAEWQQLEAALRRGSELAPANPDYLAHLGWLQQIKLTQDNDSLEIEDVLSHAALASGYYGRAAALRPTWPYDWGDLAIEEYRLGKYTSADYSQALVHAARFGPWKNDEQLLIAELGSDTLQFLSPEAEQAYLRTLNRALHRQPAEVIAIVDAYGIWELVCKLVDSGSAVSISNDAERRVGSSVIGSDELVELGHYCWQLALDP